MFRRSIKVLTILLLATAAAAGAGDDINWVRKSRLDYFGLDGSIEDLKGTYEEIIVKHQVSYRPGNEPKSNISYITAVYVSWEFFCAYVKYWADRTGQSDVTVENGLVDSRRLFEKRINFIAGISTSDEKYWDLTDTGLWRTRLIIGDSLLDPVEFKSFEDDHPLRFKGFFYDQGDTANGYRTEAFYIGFDNPFRRIPNERLKLLIEGNPGRYGFEWRFVEE
jgi:hypothetical protein